jgi:hydroxyacylglutathione hydrolase
MRYEGKIVLVTGARRGVGRLLAEHFLAGGARVIGFSRHADNAFTHDRYTPLEVDVGDAESVARGFAQVRKGFGRVDIVVNNAAVLTSQYSMIMPPAAAKSMLDANIFGTFLVSREAAKLMRASKWGRIINVGSMAARLEPMGDSIYAATKAAVSTLANVMAKELARAERHLQHAGHHRDRDRHAGPAAQGQDRCRDRRPAAAALRHAAGHLQRDRLLCFGAQRLHHRADRVPGRSELSMKADAVELLLNGALRRITNTELHSNTYLLADPAQAGDCVVVDPGLDHERVAAAIADSGWTPRAVLCTHGHFDHVGGTAVLQQRHGVPVYLRAADLKLAKLSNFMMAAFKLKARIALPEFTLLPDDGATVEAVGRRFTFHALPGHTPGSAGIAVDGLLFSGDSLYARRTALSKLPGEDHGQLRASLKKLFAWIDGQVLVLPGHGSTATIDDIHAGNEALRAFMSAAQPA